MFGYIQIHKDELKVREYNLFKAYYCGVCQSLKQEYGFPARYFLSYDTSFLSVLLHALSDEPPKICPKRCLANPAIRRPIAENDIVSSYAAAVNVLLVWFKLKDDWADNHSLRAAVMMPLMYSKKQKARKKHPELYDKIEKRLSELTTLEKENCNIPDCVAEVFGKLMGDIFDTSIIHSASQRRILSHMGFLLGRMIYLLDAWADRTEDEKKKSYNPFLLSETFDREDIKLSMDYTLSELANSFSLLDVKQNQSILENIIYLGLKNKVDAVFSEGTNIACKKENVHERPI